MGTWIRASGVTGFEASNANRHSFATPTKRQCRTLALRCFWLILFLHFNGKLAYAEFDPVAKQTLRVGTFSYSRNLESMLVAERVVREALSHHGYKMQIEYYPGKRLMAQLNNGELDGDLIRAANLGYGFQNIVRVEEPLIRTCGLVFGLQERREVSIDDTTRSVKLGIVDGVPDALEKVVRRYRHVELVFFKNLRQGVDMLEHHRVEFIAIPDAQEDKLRGRVQKPVDLVGGVLLEPGYFHLHTRYRALATDLASTVRQVKTLHNIHNCSQDLLDRKLAESGH